MSYIEIIETIVLFTLFSGVPGVVFFLFTKQKWNSLAGTLFFILLASFLADYSSYVYAKYIYPNTYGIGSIWHLVNYSLVALLFFQILPSKKLINIILLICFYVSAIVSFNFYSFNDANPIIRVVSNISFVILSLLAYFEMLKSPGKSLRKNPVFWILTGIFIFCSVTLLRNLFTQYLVFDLEVTKDLYATIVLTYLIANISKNFILFYSLILLDKGYSDSLITKQTL